MIYTTCYEPDLTNDLKKKIKETITPSLISYDNETPTQVFSLDFIFECIDNKYLLNTCEEDISKLHSLLDESVAYIELNNE